MSNEVEGQRQSARGQAGNESPPLPHTPPLGISAVRPGDPPPVPPELPSSRDLRRPEPNWLSALAASIGAVLVLIGTFLPWVVAREVGGISEIGWDQPGDASVVLIFGLLGSAVAGALWMGLRGLVIKIVLLLTGMILMILSSFEIGDVRGLSSALDIKFRVGSGLVVIAVGGVFLVLAALLDRGPWSRRAKT